MTGTKKLLVITLLCLKSTYLHKAVGELGQPLPLTLDELISENAFVASGVSGLYWLR